MVTGRHRLRVGTRPSCCTRRREDVSLIARVLLTADSRGPRPLRRADDRRHRLPGGAVEHDERDAAVPAPARAERRAGGAAQPTQLLGQRRRHQHRRAAGADRQRADDGDPVAPCDALLHQLLPVGARRLGQRRPRLHLPPHR